MTAALTARFASVLPCLVDSDGQACEDNLKRLDKDADEEVVDDEVELEQIVVICHHLFFLTIVQHFKLRLFVHLLLLEIH